MGALTKAIAVIIVLYLVYGAYLYMTGGSTDLTVILTGPATAIWGILQAGLASIGIYV